MAELTAIWLKRVRGGPMDLQWEATAVPGQGLVGNANQGGHRQVTLLGAEAWARAEAELGETVDPSARRANLMIRGLELSESRGRVLRVGACLILVRGETRPCRRMDEAHRGLQAALDPEWRAGIYGEVLTGGVNARLNHRSCSSCVQTAHESLRLQAPRGPVHEPDHPAQTDEKQSHGAVPGEVCTKRVPDHPAGGNKR